MTKRAGFAAALAFASILFAAPAFAQSVRLVGDFRDWSAFSASEGAGALCFAMSKPKEVSPQPAGYTEAFLYLTNRPSENVASELNLVAGFTFAPGSDATLSISGRTYALFTDKDAAWLKDPAQSDDLAGAMRAGSTLVIEGTSADGTVVTETFSLAGATAATKAIASGC